MLIQLFQSAKARLKVMEEEMRALQWEHEVLEQRFEKVRILYMHSTRNVEVKCILQVLIKRY